jgi:hypothetical protein
MSGEKVNPGSKADTSGKNIPVAGKPVKSNQSNMNNPGRDTTLRYKTAIMNNGENQAYTDSIKNAKTKKKK